jgi:hypothetical protein
LRESPGFGGRNKKLSEMGKFKVGQLVKQFDEDIQDFAYGIVTEVGNYAILVNWDDIPDDCEHLKNEWGSIIVIK